MSHLASVKDVQRLAGCIAALSRFISCSTDRRVEVFKVLKSRKSFEWSLECAKIFKDLQGYLTSPSILLNTVDKEELYIYLAVLAYVSSILVRIAEGT